MKIGKSGSKLNASKTKFRKYHPKHGNQNQPVSQVCIWIVNERIGKVVSGQEAPIRKYKWSESKTSNFSEKSESWQRKPQIETRRRSTSTLEKFAIFLAYVIIQSSIFMFFASIEKQCTYDCTRYGLGLSMALMLMMYVLSTLFLIQGLLFGMFDAYDPNWMESATPFILSTIVPSIYTMHHFL